MAYPPKQVKEKTQYVFSKSYKITFNFDTGDYDLIHDDKIISSWSNHADALSARAEALHAVEVIKE